MSAFSHPFVRPLWLPVLVVVVALGRALPEAVTSSLGWAIGFGVIGAVALWGLLVGCDPEQSRKDDRK